MRLEIGFVLCVTAAAIFATPNLTRRSVLFGFAVPANFRESGDGRKSIAGSARLWQPL